MHLLMIEDDPFDVQLLRECITERGLPWHIDSLTTAKDALTWARGAGKNDGSTLPALILFDMNLPDGTGLDVLRAYREAPALAQTPCWMLTSADHPRLRKAAEDAGADGYLTKADDWIGLNRILDQLELAVGTLPVRKSHRISSTHAARVGVSRPLPTA